MKNILLLMCKGTEIFEAAAFFDVAGWSGSEGAEQISVTIAAAENPLHCTFGMKIIPDILFSGINPSNYDALAIPGGFEEYGFYEDAFSDVVSGIIRAFHSEGKPIAAICVGALAIAHCSILTGKKATTYHLGNGKRRKQLADFGAVVTDAMMVCENNIITSTSPASAHEVALLLLEKLTDAETAAKIRASMGFI